MKWKILLSGLPILLITSMALGGYVQPAPVQVTLNADGSGQAFGDMVTARFAANDVEFIGCGVRSFSDGAGGVVHFGFCQGADSAGVKGFCSTFDPAILDVMKAITDKSFVIFEWDASGICTRIGFSAQSFYLRGD